MSNDAGKESGDGKASKSCCPMVPLSKATLTTHYMPLLGIGSYSLLSVNVLNPALNFGVLSKRDLTNVLLATSVIGTGCYIYSRPHLQVVGGQSRLLYAGYGSVLFTFSSILAWAILRSALPNNVAFGSAVGLASCYLFAKTGHNYLSLVDSQITKN